MRRSELTNSETDGSAQRPHANHQTTGNGNELRRSGQLRNRDECAQTDTQPDTQEHGVAPDRVRGARCSCSHAHEKDDHGHKRHDGRPADVAGRRAPQPGQDSRDAVDNHGNTIPEPGAQRVRLVEHADLESKVVVGREEDETLDKNAYQRNGKVASVPEKSVVEHAVLLEAHLVHGQSHTEGTADNERRNGVGVSPGIGVLRPRQAHAEEHQARGQESVSNPVELRELLRDAEARLVRRLWRVIQRQNECRGHEVDGRRHVPVIPHARGVAVARERAASQERHKASHRGREVIGRLRPGAVASGEHLGGNGVEEGLGAVGAARDGKAGNGHAHRGCAGDDDGADDAAGREADEEPAAAPVVCGLGDDGGENDCHDGDCGG